MKPNKKCRAANQDKRTREPDLPTNRTRANQRYSQSASAATCLVRVLEQHGLPASYEDICKHLSASPGSNDVINFLDVAEGFGLTGRPVVLTSAEWQNIPTASILHWGPEDLVVIESFQEDSVTVHDPARGTRQVDMTEFRRQFTGVVLAFEPTNPSQV